jgi:hypothetical protein
MQNLRGSTSKQRAIAGIKQSAEGLRQSFDSIVSILRIITDLRVSNFSSELPLNERLAILGTGPSLLDSFRDIGADVPVGVSIMTVNEGFKAANFATLKPSHHVIADPIYWDSDSYSEYAHPLVLAISDAKWSITLYLPSKARGSRLHDELKKTNSRTVFYRDTPFKGLSILEYLAFRSKLGMPKPQNVLVAAISVGLWLGFSHIAIVGADHTWHRELEVSDSNVLTVRQIHSYDGNVDRKPFLKPSGVGKSLAGKPITKRDTFSVREIFMAWSIVHESYEKLEQIARRQGAHIWNCSSTTFIDAFERKSFREFLQMRVDP